MAVPTDIQDLHSKGTGVPGSKAVIQAGGEGTKPSLCTIVLGSTFVPMGRFMCTRMVTTCKHTKTRELETVWFWPN